MMEQDGKTLTEDDYSHYIDKMQEAYPDKSRETLEHETSPLEFCITRCADYLAHPLDLYIASVFKTHFTKE